MKPTRCGLAFFVVASAIIEALDNLNLQFPDADKEVKKELRKVKGSLLAEKS